MTETCSCIVHCPLNHLGSAHKSNSGGSFDGDHGPGQDGSGGKHHHGGHGGHGTSGGQINSFTHGHQNSGSPQQFEDCDGDLVELDDLI